MSLFETTEKANTRKWQCFVCGVNFESYEEYKAHIIQNHEEGREYIVCPDCEAPVRDMKMHYQAKHPKRLMPKNIQMKVAVWRDFTSGGKKKKTRKPTFRSGTFSSSKAGCDLHYRSGMECEFYELLETDNDVVSFFAEPFKVPYCYLGEWHDYIPDLRVNFADGTTQIWEIKPSQQTHYKQNQAKWGSMNDYALNHGWEFVVQTETGLDKLKNKIKRQSQS